MVINENNIIKSRKGEVLILEARICVLYRMTKSLRISRNAQIVKTKMTRNQMMMNRLIKIQDRGKNKEMEGHSNKLKKILMRRMKMMKAMVKMTRKKKVKKKMMMNPIQMKMRKQHLFITDYQAVSI